MTIRLQRYVFAAGLAAAGLGCVRAPREAPPARPVRVEPVNAHAVTAGLRYSATIQPYEQVPLAFRVGGYVREVRQVPGPDGRLRSVQQGDAVTRGTVLARLDAADYQEKVNQAQAQMAEMEASLVKARADGARAHALYENQAMTRPDYDAATAGLAAALARKEAARAQLEAAQISLRDASLAAPTDGVVLSRSVEVGSLAGSGAVAFAVADLTRVKAVFGVPDSVVQRVRIGSALPLTSDAWLGVEFPGRVTAVSPAADNQSRVFSVEVTIPNPDQRLKPGMIASVDVSSPDLSGIAAGSPTVSVSAVVKSSRPGAFAVFVAEGASEEATARARDVSLGRISGNRVAVESGLGMGDRVIVSGASLLVDGDRVRVIPGREGE